MTVSKTGAAPVHRGKRGARIPLEQRRRARKLILQALYEWMLAGNSPLDIAAKFHADTHGKVDWDFFDAVFLDIPRQFSRLNEYLSPVLDRKTESLDPIERAILYQGCYELAYRVDVPYRVVINECVELAKTFGATDGHKYINGVLDKLVPDFRSAEWAAHKSNKS